jgi:hypothetical protein
VQFTFLTPFERGIEAELKKSLDPGGSEHLFHSEWVSGLVAFVIHQVSPSLSSFVTITPSLDCTIQLSQIFTCFHFQQCGAVHIVLEFQLVSDSGQFMPEHSLHFERFLARSISPQPSHFRVVLEL